MCHCEGCIANKENAMDRLTRDQLHEIVNAAVATRDRSHQNWRSIEAKSSTLQELRKILDRYGL